MKISKIVLIKENKQEGLKITVENNGNYFTVHNLNVEACIVVERQTCYLKLDRYNFIMLPAQLKGFDFHQRDFKTIMLENSGCDDGQGHIITNENYVYNFKKS